jgi:magnesium chelatase accessory protein
MRPTSIPADLPNSDASRIVRAAGIDFHVQVAGTGPVVLLLHGTASATHTWRHVLPMLAATATVIAPDLPGHGFTVAGDDALTLPGMAHAVRALLDALALEPVVVAGHSAGAAVMLRMALDGMLPAARALVGFGASIVPPHATYMTIAAPLVHPFVTSPLAARVATAIARLPGVPATMLAATGSTVDDVSRSWYERFLRSEPHVRAALAMMATFELPALLRDLPRLMIPLMLVHGAKDGYIPLAALRRAASRTPGTALTVVEGAGHLLHEELPARAVATIRDALGRSDISDMSPRQGAT